MFTVRTGVKRRDAVSRHRAEDAAAFDDARQLLERRGPLDLAYRGYSSADEKR